MNNKHVILYGGSFDPPHMCHVFTTAWLLAAGQWDQVWWLPAYQHPFGKILTDFQTRISMIREALSPFQSHLVKVCPVEQKLDGEEVPHPPVPRSSRDHTATTTAATAPARPRPTYTVEVVSHLKKTYPTTKFSMVTGTDIITDLPAWREPDRLLRMLEQLVVMGREGTPPHSPTLGPELGDYDHKVHRAGLWLPPVSSTRIRDMVSRGENIDDLVPKDVGRIIASQGLYK